MATKNPEIPPFPLLFKHMALAIFRGKSLGGLTKSAFESSMTVALSRLIEYRLAATTSSLGNVILTSAGRTREAVHRKESDTAAKTVLFDKLFIKHYAEGKQSKPRLESLTPDEQRATLDKRADLSPPGAKASEDSPGNMSPAGAKAAKKVPKGGFPATKTSKVKPRKRAAPPKKGHAPQSRKGKAKKPPTGSIRSAKTQPLKNRKPLK